MDNNFLIIDTRVNDMYYLDSTKSIKKIRVYQVPKLKKIEASNLLKEKGIEHNQVLQILLTDITLKIPVTELNNYIIKGEDKNE